jgi:hypothetical protein
MSQENPISKQPLIRYVNRKQMSWRAVDVEQLVCEDHLARAIGTRVGRLNLRAFYQAIASSVAEGGRPGDFGMRGERRSSGFPAEAGNRRSTGKLSSAWQSRGILPCLDQKPAGSAPVSRSRAGQSAAGDALGLPYLQPATVDPLAQTAAPASHRLDSEKRRVRKKTEWVRAAQAKSQNLPRTTKTNLRATFLHSFELKGAGLNAASRQSSHRTLSSVGDSRGWPTLPAFSLSEGAHTNREAITFQ